MSAELAWFLYALAGWETDLRRVDRAARARCREAYVTAPKSLAETLRSAATLMRERAQAAPQAPWSTRTFPASRSGVHLKSEMHMIVADGVNIAAADKSAIAHIAGMHPNVALAVADWLDAEAEKAAQMDGYEDSAVYPLMLSGYRLPLAVARAFLGEQEGEAP